MPVPQFLLDLLQLLLDLAVPAAFCTLAAAGVSLRHEGGTNFHVNGRTGKWVLWTVVLLTLPQLLSWIAAQGITIPSGSGTVGTSWLASMETVFKNFVSQIVVAKLVPVIAAFFVLKATLDGAAGENPLGSIVASLFLMSLPATVQLMQGWNSGGQYAVTDMLTSLWNYIAGQIMPAAAGLACVGAVINFVRHRPWTRLVFAGSLSERERSSRALPGDGGLRVNSYEPRWSTHESRIMGRQHHDANHGGPVFRRGRVSLQQRRSIRAASLWRLRLADVLRDAPGA